MVLKLGELFCGPGGMAQGAKLAASDFQSANGGDLPIEHIWGVDKDPQAIETYKANLPGTAVCEDAIAFVEDSLECKQPMSSFPPVDALAFGFPCNDFSLVGKQRGFQGRYGNLYLAGVKAIQRLEPLFFVAENVSGIHSVNSGVAFQKILNDLEKAGPGYDLTIHLYKFEEYGIPQTRHRYIITGFRKGSLDKKGNTIRFKVPSPAPYRQVNISCKKALEGIGEHTPNSEPTKQSTRVIWRLRFTPPGENAWKLDEVAQYSDKCLRQYLEMLPWYDEVIRPLGSIKEMRKMIEYSRLRVNAGSKMSHIYKRLIAGKPSYTITGSGGGGTHVYHWEEPRALNNRERARLQSFDDKFIFSGNKSDVRKQIGMAVPPEGARIIFRAILDTIAGNDYPSIDETNYRFKKDHQGQLFLG